MEFLNIPFKALNAFFLISIRVGIILYVFPFFSAKVIPQLSKVGLTFIIALILYPVVAIPPVEFPATIPGVFLLVMAELIAGAILGFMVQLFFEGVRIMGQLVGFQTGFSIANVIDPQNGIQVSILSNMAYLMVVVLFLLLNGHHILLNALRESFDIIRIGGVGLKKPLLSEIVSHSGSMFVIGLKIGAPAIAALLFVKVVFGLVTKLIPQMNIMIVAFPLQIVIGLFFFGISLRILLVFVERYLGNLNALMLNTMGLMRI